MAHPASNGELFGFINDNPQAVEAMVRDHVGDSQPDFERTLAVVKSWPHVVDQEPTPATFDRGVVRLMLTCASAEPDHRVERAAAGYPLSVLQSTIPEIAERIAEDVKGSDFSYNLNVVRGVRDRRRGK